MAPARTFELSPERLDGASHRGPLGLIGVLAGKSLDEGFEGRAVRREGKRPGGLRAEDEGRVPGSGNLALDAPDVGAHAVHPRMAAVVILGHHGSGHVDDEVDVRPSHNARLLDFDAGRHPHRRHDDDHQRPTRPIDPRLGVVPPGGAPEGETRPQPAHEQGGDRPFGPQPHHHDNRNFHARPMIPRTPTSANAGQRLGSSTMLTSTSPASSASS